MRMGQDSGRKILGQPFKKKKAVAVFPVLELSG